MKIDLERISTSNQYIRYSIKIVLVLFTCLHISLQEFQTKLHGTNGTNIEFWSVVVRTNAHTCSYRLHFPLK